MYRLEKLNSKGEIEKSKEYKTIKECAQAFDMPYHVIQRFVSYCSGEITYKKAVTERTKDLIKNYRIVKIKKTIDVDMSEPIEEPEGEPIHDVVKVPLYEVSIFDDCVDPDKRASPKK